MDWFDDALEVVEVRVDEGRRDSCRGGGTLCCEWHSEKSRIVQYHDIEDRV